jgi:hypothetical protein
MNKVMNVSVYLILTSKATKIRSRNTRVYEAGYRVSKSTVKCSCIHIAEFMFGKYVKTSIVMCNLPTQQQKLSG